MIIRQVAFLSLKISFYYITIRSIYSFAPRFAMIYGKRVWCHVVGFNRWNRTFHIEDSVCVTFTICRNLYFSKYWKWELLVYEIRISTFKPHDIRLRSVGRQLQKSFMFSEYRTLNSTNEFMFRYHQTNLQRSDLPWQVE